jgi:hypothetical protein
LVAAILEEAPPPIARSLGAVQADAAGIAQAIERRWLLIAVGVHSVSLTRSVVSGLRPSAIERAVSLDDSSPERQGVSLAGLLGAPQAIIHVLSSDGSMRA